MRIILCLLVSWMSKTYLKVVEDAFTKLNFFSSNRCWCWTWTSANGRNWRARTASKSQRPPQKRTEIPSPTNESPLTLRYKSVFDRKIWRWSTFLQTFTEKRLPLSQLYSTFTKSMHTTINKGVSGKRFLSNVCTNVDQRMRTRFKGKIVLIKSSDFSENPLISSLKLVFVFQVCKAECYTRGKLSGSENQELVSM